MLSKKKRLESPSRHAWCHAQHCLNCGSEPPCDPFHVKSKGSGGGDEEWNLIPVCRKCHMLWHHLGWRMFLDKNPALRHELMKLGWTWKDRKLTHDG